MYGFHGGRCGGAFPPCHRSGRAHAHARCARLHSCVRGGVRFDGLREALFFVLFLLVQRCEVGCVC